MREQTYVPGPLQQPVEVFLGVPLHLRQSVLADFSHDSQRIDIHRALE